MLGSVGKVLFVHLVSFLYIDWCLVKRLTQPTSLFKLVSTTAPWAKSNSIQKQRLLSTLMKMTGISCLRTFLSGNQIKMPQKIKFKGDDHFFSLAKPDSENGSISSYNEEKNSIDRT